MAESAASLRGAVQELAGELRAERKSIRDLGVPSGVSARGVWGEHIFTTKDGRVELFLRKLGGFSSDEGFRVITGDSPLGYQGRRIFLGKRLTLVLDGAEGVAMVPVEREMSVADLQHFTLGGGIPLDGLIERVRETSRGVIEPLVQVTSGYEEDPEVVWKVTGRRLLEPVEQEQYGRLAALAEWISGNLTDEILQPWLAAEERMRIIQESLQRNKSKWERIELRRLAKEANGLGLPGAPSQIAREARAIVRQGAGRTI